MKKSNFSVKKYKRVYSAMLKDLTNSQLLDEVFLTHSLNTLGDGALGTWVWEASRNALMARLKKIGFIPSIKDL